MASGHRGNTRSRLLSSQCLCRGDVGCAAGGQVGCDQRHQNQYSRRSQKCDGMTHAGRSAGGVAVRVSRQRRTLIAFRATVLHHGASNERSRRYAISTPDTSFERSGPSPVRHFPVCLRPPGCIDLHCRAAARVRRSYRACQFRNSANHFRLGSPLVQCSPAACQFAPPASEYTPHGR